MIVIIDYGMGNVGSILNMFKKIGQPAMISSDKAEIEKGDKLVLPGVGAFDSGMTNLNERGFVPLLNEMVLNRNIPILGICLGMQLFTKSSEEGKLSGLGWVNAKTVKFKFEGQNAQLKVPHMGWNLIKPIQTSCLFKEIDPKPRFYFVHSYHVKCADKTNILTKTIYGHEFTSSFVKNNIAGVQFHPEKSHKYGMRFLKYYAELF